MRKKNIKEIVIGLILFSVVLLSFVNGLEPSFLHPDEAVWIKYGEYFKLFWIDKDFSNDQWEEWGSIDQPPVGKYIVGASLFLYGKEKAFQEVDKIKNYDWDHDIEWNRAHGAIPSRKMLFIVRLTMAIFGALTCLLLYFIGRIVFGTNVGVIAALLLAYNPLMLAYSRRAMVDTPVLFFMTANVLLIIGFYRSILKQRKILPFFLAFLIGINAALAVGTKYNGGLSLVIFTFFCIIMSLTRIKGMKPQSGKQIRLIFISWLISVLVCGIIFLAINPYYYCQTLERLVDQVPFHADFFRDLQKKFHKVALTSLPQKITFVVTRTLTPKYYVLLGKILKIPVDLILFLIGLVLLFRSELKYCSIEKKLSYKSIILIWVLVTFFGISAWIPLNWDRYYLPVIPCIVMIIAYFLDMIIKRSWPYLKRVGGAISERLKILISKF